MSPVDIYSMQENLGVADYDDRIEIFKRFRMDYFTMDKTGEKNYRDIYYLFQEWSSRDRFVSFFTQPLSKPHFIELRKKMLPEILSIGACVPYSPRQKNLFFPCFTGAWMAMYVALGYQSAINERYAVELLKQYHKDVNNWEYFV